MTTPLPPNVCAWRVLPCLAWRSRPNPSRGRSLAWACVASKPFFSPAAWDKLSPRRSGCWIRWSFGDILWDARWYAESSARSWPLPMRRRPTWRACCMTSGSVNCLVFSKEFATAMERACQEEIPLDEAEQATMGFTHCDTGRALAEKWKLADEVIEVIAHHHAIEQSQKAQPLVALVHLSDLLCRMRGLGYGYYERHKADLIGDPAWAILSKEYRDLEGMDLVRFTFELDEAVAEIHSLVATVFGSAPART